MATEQATLQQSQPAVEAAMTVGHTIWRRYAVAPGVIPLAVTHAVAGRISRMADDRVPLLTDLVQRWALFATGSGSSWADLPYVTAARWADESAAPVEDVARTPTSAHRALDQGVAAPLATIVGVQPLQREVVGQPNNQTILAPSVAAPPVAAARAAAAPATPLAAQPTRPETGGQPDSQAANDAPSGSASAAVDKPDHLLATWGDRLPVWRDAGGRPTVQATLATPVKAAPAVADEAAIPLASAVGIPSTRSDDSVSPRGQSPVVIQIRSAPVSALPTWDAGGHATVQADRATTVDFTPAVADGATIPLVSTGDAQSTHRDSDAQARPLAAQSAPTASPVAAALVGSQSPVATGGEAPIRRSMRVGPPLVVAAQPPATAGVAPTVSPMLSRQRSVGETGPADWQQAEQNINLAQPAPPVNSAPQTVGQPMEAAFGQPFIQTQAAFARDEIQSAPLNTPVPVAAAPLHDTIGAVRVPAPDEDDRRQREPLVMAKSVEQAAIGVLSPVALPATIVVDAATSTQAAQDEGPAAYHPAPHMIVETNSNLVARRWPERVEADSSAPGLVKPGPELVGRAINRRRVSAPEIVPTAQPLAATPWPPTDERAAMQLAPAAPGAQLPAAPEQTLPPLSRLAGAAPALAMFPVVRSEPAARLFAAKQPALPMARNRPLPATPLSEPGRASALPLATAPAAGQTPFVQMAPASAPSGAAPASAGSITAGAAATEPPGATAVPADQEAQNEELIEKMTRRLIREMVIERERQGWQPWNRKS